MTATFSSVSADAGPVHKSAGSYTVAPCLVGPTNDGKRRDVHRRYCRRDNDWCSDTGVAAVDSSCTLGTGARGVNECKGSFLFDGTIHGETGTYRADMFDWTAGG